MAISLTKRIPTGRPLDASENDYNLTTIENALNNFGFANNSVCIGGTPSGLYKLEVNGIQLVYADLQFSGFSVQNKYASSSVFGVCYFDFQNELGVRKSHIFSTIETDGGSTQNFAVTASGTPRSTDARYTALSIKANGTVQPGSDNVQTLGAVSSRWSVVYAGTGTINTSDENEKTLSRSLSFAELSAASDIKQLVKAFKFKDAVAKKGNSARWHFGFIAQEVANAFINNQLNPENYGIYCSDSWYEKTNWFKIIENENGEQFKVDCNQSDPDAQKEIITQQNEAEGFELKTRLGLRYDELACFLIAVS